MTAVVGTLAVVALVVVVGLWLDRRIALLPPMGAPAGPPPPRVDATPPGSTAATAVRVPRSWRSRIAAGRCACGQPLAVASDEPITFGGRTLVIVRLACAACGHHRSVYLEPIPG